MRLIQFLLALLMLSGAASASGLLLLGAGGTSAFSGPGDIVPGAQMDISVRAYTKAYATGSNAAALLLRASDSTTDLINILTNGNFDSATANTFCTSTTCSWKTGTDQTGNGNSCTQATAANQPARVSNDSPFSGFSESMGFTAPSSMALNCGSAAGIESSTFTYIAWIKLTASAGLGDTIIGNSAGTGDFIFDIGTSPFHLILSVSGVAVVGTSTGSVTPNVWTCVAVSYNGSTGAYAFYFNGTVSGSGTNLQTATPTGRTIGNDAFGTLAFGGNIAEVLIYNSVVSAPNINSICNATSP